MARDTRGAADAEAQEDARRSAERAQEGGAGAAPPVRAPGELEAERLRREGGAGDSADGPVVTLLGGRVVRGDHRTRGGDRARDESGEWRSTVGEWEGDGQRRAVTIWHRGELSVEHLRLVESDLAAQPGSMRAGDVSTAAPSPGAVGPEGAGPGPGTRSPR